MEEKKEQASQPWADVDTMITRKKTPRIPQETLGGFISGREGRWRDLSDLS